MSKEPPEVRDTGTPEMAKRHRLVPRVKANSGYDFDIYVADGSEADRLLLEGAIDTLEHSTLLSYTVLLHKARMLGPKSPAYERTSTSDPVFLSTRMSDALRMVGSINGALVKSIGSAAQGEVLNVCVNLIKLLPERHLAFKKSIAALRVALDEAYSG